MDAAMSKRLEDCFALAGYYAMPGSVGRLCPAGFYCTQNSTNPQPCPETTPLSQDGSMNESACKVNIVCSYDPQCLTLLQSAPTLLSILPTVFSTFLKLCNTSQGQLIVDL